MFRPTFFKSLLLLSLLIRAVAGYAQTTSTWFRANNPTEYIRIGDLDVTGNQLTVEALVYKTSDISLDVVSKHCNSTDCNYFLRMGQAAITTTDGFAIVNSCTTLSLNTFYHVAMTYDGAALKYYVNGGLVNQVPASGNLVTNNYEAKIGFIACFVYADPNPESMTEQWRGYIDEVRIWNIARPQDSIIKYKKTSLPGPTTQPGLRGYYRLNSTLNRQGNFLYTGFLMGAPGASIGNTMTLPATLDPPVCSLPASLLSFEAIGAQKNTEITALVNVDVDSKSFELQKSTDAVHWETVYQVNAISPSSVQSIAYLDETITSEKMYYRLVEILTNNESNVMATKVVLHTLAPFVTVSPNPNNGSFSIEVQQSKEERSLFQLMDVHGRIFLQGSLKQGPNSIVLEQALPGIYLLSVVSDTSKKIIRLEIQ